MSTEQQITVRESSTSSPRTKSPPQSSSIPVPFIYKPSDDGTDENLLILLHGLGDTHVPFGKLGQQLHLPQTATLALRAPEQVPFLYEQAFQWYTSFDPLGELIECPNPTPALDLMTIVTDHLMKDCAWPPHKIHFFGFAQGGTVAAEFALKHWRAQLSLQHLLPSPETSGSAESGSLTGAFGSVVSVSGPLISYPTLSTLCPTPLFIFHRLPSAESALPPGAITALTKGFTKISEVKIEGEGMPRSKEEFEPIMRFWSERLGRRRMEGLYEVMSGMVSPS